MCRLRHSHTPHLERLERAEKMDEFRREAIERLKFRAEAAEFRKRQDQLQFERDAIERLRIHEGDE